MYSPAVFVLIVVPCILAEPLLFKPRKVTVNSNDNGDGAVACTDGVSQCGRSETCCRLRDGTPGCCPFREGICCDDGTRCCPAGSQCNGGRCDYGGNAAFSRVFPMFSKPIKTAMILSAGNENDNQPIDGSKEPVICPGHEKYCEEKQTCCQNEHQDYMCCPLDNATCCKDGRNCCPHGYNCDLRHHSCRRNDEHVPFTQRVKGAPKTISSKDFGLKRPVKFVPCPDPGYQCPDGNTCCKLPSGRPGCCPLPKANCCPDRIHCCPTGHKCGASGCESGNNRAPYSVKTPALPIVLDLITCPDNSTCPVENTCCKMTNGRYGCCPMPKATCCQDGVHCCPNTYTCDDQAAQCRKGDLVTPWAEKTSSNAPVGDNYCPDEKTVCHYHETCCALKSGNYSCCPLPNAVCCSDGEHCCPTGYACHNNRCEPRSNTPLLDIIEAKERLASVICPDGESECPDGNTCCKLSSGQFGCCPLPMATCCDDGIHCCPNGYTCDVSAGTCNHGRGSMAIFTKVAAASTSSNVNLLKKEPASPINELVGAVICPDGESECPNGNTCCKLSSGQWACCPLPKATCCSDGIHCCPNGYTCDVSTGTCNIGLESLAWVAKHAANPVTKKCDHRSIAKESVSIGVVVCPDGQSQCPSGNTCCKLTTGGYGCCPLPMATCCNDGIHCCPNGYTCDVGAGTCNKGRGSMPFFAKVSIKDVSSPNTTIVGDVICPDGESECPNDNTCCKLSSGQFGCCPLPNAVCCEDGQHCCPNGYTCDVSAGTCNKGLESLSRFAKITAKPVKNEGDHTQNRKINSSLAVICPDRRSQCPTGSTCCKMISAGYGCCPLPQATCCNDGIHCCPNSYKCDVSARTCSRGVETVAWVSKTAATSVTSQLKSVPVAAVVCPDGQSECPSGNTCCKLTSGGYGCCPLPKATCCNDGIHCCPNGYTCDVGAGTCSKGEASMPFFSKVTAIQIPSTVDMLKKEPASPISGHVDAVICPDGESECPNGNTCCKLSTGQFGCCPLPKATCCDDGIHCCPNGYTCDVGAGTCSKGFGSMAIFAEVAAKRPVKFIICPDARTQCPDMTTCCPLDSQQYGCCPLESATCCSDHLHCCPNGYACDVAAGTCNKGSSVLPLFKKIPPMNILDTHSMTRIPATTIIERVDAVICPDGESECPNGNTCCKLSTGQFGCCPLPKATCCSDGIHCCPNGYTCDVSAGTCNQGRGSMAIFTKVAAAPTSSKVKLLKKNVASPITGLVGAVICPDGESECPNGNTCCKLSSGQYGCCPLPKATCCDDGVHCCPNGYTCDVGAGTCNKGFGSMPFFAKVSIKDVSSPNTTIVGDVICPDGESECPNDNTCCKLSSGQWGCCPLPNAICCEDGQHCCPNGYTCDVGAGTCNKGLESLAWFAKRGSNPVMKQNYNLSVAKKSVNIGAVVCPDGQSQCPSGSTCCKLTTSGYGCCPLPKATCCNDGIHCCPNGYTCDVGAGTCSKGEASMPFFSKVAAVQIPSTIDMLKKEPASPISGHVGAVICPDGESECPNGNTCCKLSTGQFGCCPLPKATCCDDGIHCCPNGYTCDVGAGTCNKGTGSMPFFVKVLKKDVASPKTAIVGGVICPDGVSECHDNNTCCKMSSGQFDCCPLPNAVCCEDGRHCCPNGYTCDDIAGTCNREGSTLVWLGRTVHATRVLKRASTGVDQEAAYDILCPDSKSSCPDTTTCCLMSDGAYGCCPMKKAVCCTDHLHCCPENYTCDIERETCVTGNQRRPWLRKARAKQAARSDVRSKSVPCPGGGYCPDAFTCCSMGGGRSGCCPYENATCCSDLLHCCPGGTRCVQEGESLQCVPEQKMSPTELVKKFIESPKEDKLSGPAILVPKVDATSVICPDGSSWCNDGETCCILSDGHYGCCPYKEGVCCGDHLHCCPSGYNCSQSTCDKLSGQRRSLPLVRPRPAGKLAARAPLPGDAGAGVVIRAPVTAIDCGHGVSCPEGTTCCDMITGEPGCCPVPNASCCEDKLHCCAKDQKCDKSGTKCVTDDGSLVTDALKKFPATKTN